MAFKYSPLPPPKIRLLKIESTVGDHVSCTLHHVSSVDDREYLALSYTWGDATPSEEIKLNGQAFKVTPNLLAALRAIDVISIDQQNNEERSQEVRRMDQIYRRASCVLVWLGNEADGSVKVMSVLKWMELFRLQQSSEHAPLGSLAFTGPPRRTSRQIEDGRSRLTERLRSQYGMSEEQLLAMNELLHDLVVVLPERKRQGETLERGEVLENDVVGKLLAGKEYRKHLLHREDSFWKSLRVLCSRKWFSRVWTYQEILLSKQAVVLCGFEAVEWQLVMDARRQILDYHCADDLYRLKTSIMSRFDMARFSLDSYSSFGKGSWYGQIEQVGLAQLLMYTKYLEATDERDHIYGLFGLLKHSVRGLITVDYNLQPSRVFTRATVVACQIPNGMENWCRLLERYASAPKKIAGLPSWCPDYSTGNDFTYGSPDRDTLISVYDWRAHFTPLLKFDNDTALIDIVGVRLGQVKRAAKAAVSIDFETFRSTEKTPHILKRI
ncbi:MAG: hypothetical protein M1821_002473 [Bathelium mastoideum]|nr:MAG: hypothetical protein M1821_002473 [Bathelium mastoideum]